MQAHTQRKLDQVARPDWLRSLTVAVAIAVLASIAPLAHAGPTWDGGGADTNINTAGNWNDDALPPFSGGTSTLFFSTGGTSATLNTSLDIARIILNATPTFSIGASGGSSLTLQGENVGGVNTGITAAMPWLVGSGSYTLSAPVILGLDQSWNVTNGSGPTTLVVSGPISGSGRSLTKTGNGTLALAAANTYTGPTTISQGTLALRTGGNLAGPVSVGSGAAFQFNNAFGASTTFAPAITGGGNLAKVGAGAVRLTSAANAWTGSTTVSEGTLVVNDPAALGSGTSAIIVTGRLNDYRPGDGNSNADMTAYGGQLLLASGSGVTLARDLALSGAGIRGLTGVNINTTNYPSARWGGGYAFQSVGNNTISGNIATSGTLTVISSQFGMLTLSGSVRAPAGSTIMVAGNGDMLAQGPITADRIIPNAGGTLILTNTSNAIGAIGGVSAVGFMAGRVRVATGDVLKNTVFQSSSFGGPSITLEIRAASADVPSFGTSGLTFSNNGNIGFLFVDQAAGGTDINQSIPIKTVLPNTFSQQLSGRNGYGVNISGTGGDNLLGGQVFSVTNSSNGTLTYNGNFTTTAARGNDSVTLGGSGDGVINGGIATTVAGNGFNKSGVGRWLITGTVAAGSRNTLNNNLGAGTLEIRSFSTLATGTTQLSGGNLTYSGTGETYSGNILFNSASSQLLANQPSGSPLILTGTATVASNVAYNLGGSSTLDNVVQTSLPAVGTNAFNKRGMGTWVLSATNRYTGNTSILGGTLRLQAGAGNIVQDGSAIIFNADTFLPTAAGTLIYSGANNATSTETVGALTPTAGAARIIASGSGSGSATLTFSGTAARGAGATVDFAPTSTGTIAFTTAPAGTNGILGGWATFGGTDWVNSGATASRFAGYTPLAASSNNAATNFSLDTGSVALSGAAAVNSLKLVGTSGTTSVSLGGTLTNTTGGVVFDNSAGSAQITGSQLGAAGTEVIIHTGGSGAASDVLTIGSQIGSGASLLTKSGSGTLVLNAANAYTGNTTINEGTLRLSNNAALGAPGTNNRTTIRQAGVLDLGLASMSGTAGILDGAGRITSSAASGTATLAIGQGNFTTGYFTGIIENGTAGGHVGVTKVGTGTQFVTGANTYTGPTQINAGTLAVTSLANIGSNSGIGAGDSSSDATNAASLVFNGGILQYTGANATVFQATQTPSVSIDRLFTLAGNGTIDSSGQYGNNALAAATRNDATLIFNKTSAVAFSGAGARTLTLQGNSTGDNRINLQLIDNPNSGSLSVTKAGTGLWVLGNTSNSYSGQTQVTGGALVVGADAPGSLTLPTTSNLNLAGGVLETSGTFSRALGTGANQVRLSAGASGFSAGVADLRVNIGNGASLQWNTATFLPSSGRLDLNSSTSLGVVDFANPIDLNGATAATTRTISVQDNSNATTDYAMISGVISGVGGITKTTQLGAGGATVALRLSGANTYTGDTVINNGALVVETIGSSTSTASNLGGGSGKVTINPFNSGELNYIGAGETSNRLIELGGAGSTNRISSNGSGPLVLSNVSNVGGGAKTLLLGGNYAGANEISSNLTNAGGTLTVQIDSGATWILSGSNSFTGGISWAAAGGALGIGSDNALGSGTSSLLGGYNQGHNALIFAVNGSRTIANPWTGDRRSSSITFGGTNSITLTGSWSARSSAIQPFSIQNAIGEGGVLTFSGPVTLENPSTIIAFTGGGQTVFNSVITNSAAGQTLVYSGTGTLSVQGDQSGATTFSTSNQGTGVILFSAANSILGTGANVSASAGSTLAAGYAVDQAFLTRVSSTTASFAVGLGADSANNVDFSSAGRNLTNASLGAVGSATRVYSGTLTPNATAGGYRLGGGGGTLDFRSPLTGASNTLTVGGDVTGLGGTVILSSAANTYGGATTVQRGILQISSLTNAGSNSSTGTNATINLSSGTSTGTLRYAGSGHSSNRTINILGTVGGTVDASGSGALDMTSGTISAAANTVVTLTGTSTASNTIGMIAGSGASLAKAGPGMWRLSGANTYSGNTTVGEGILRFSSLASGTNAQSLGRGTLVNLGVANTSAGEIDFDNNAGGTLDKNITALGSGRNRIRNSGAGTLELSGTLTKDGTILELAGGTFSVSGRITGASANSDLFVNNAAVTLTNTNNDYNGPTYVYGGGSLTLGANNVIPSASAVILGGTGSDTGTGTLNTGLFTDTIASLTSSSLGATVGISGSGATLGGLTTTGNLTFGAGADTLALSLTSPTLGRYTLITYQGTRSGTFDTVTGNGNYNVVYGAASNSTIDLQHKATIGTIAATPASATIIVGGTTAFGFTVQNSAPALGADLLATVTTGSNVVGSASPGAVAAGATSDSISGLSFTSNTVGLGQTGLFTLTDAAATKSPQQGSVTVNVLNHSLASFAATDTDAKTLNFGTYQDGAWTGGDGGNGTLAYSIFNIASLGFTDAQTAGLDLYDWVFSSGNDVFSLGYSPFTNLASGSSNAFTASVLSPGSLVDGLYTGTYVLKFRDQQNLAGATNTRDLAITLSANVIVVPEPGALALAGIGIAAAYAYRSRRSRCLRARTAS